MGLDMYLQAKRHIPNYDHTPEGHELTKRILDGLGIKNHEPFKNGFIEISLPVGYWRKDNAVHNWFVCNVQNGADDCAEYYVSREALENLKASCQRVINKEVDPEVEMPTQSGFFFGSTEYDDWYFDGLRDTVEIIDNIFNNPELEKCDIYYRASW